MPFIIDYKEEVKKLISKTYEPANMLSSEFQKTTIEVLEGFCPIFPGNELDEHMIYEALLELNFEPNENPANPLEFYWYFKRK